jgi:hypothetical protein
MAEKEMPATLCQHE